jgi:thiol-disulfide isomerase/thioredoxin
MSPSLWQLLLVLTAALAMLEGVLVVGILRQLGAVQMQIGPPRYGNVEEGPEVGRSVVISGLPRRPTMLIFLGPTCSFCKAIVPGLPAIARAYPEVSVVGAVMGDDSEEKTAYAMSLGVESRTDLDALFSEWSLPGTPYVVGIGSDDTILARGVVNNLPQLDRFVEGLLESDRAAAEAEVMEPPPDDLGERVSVE